MAPAWPIVRKTVSGGHGVVLSLHLSHGCTGHGGGLTPAMADRDTPAAAPDWVLA